MSNFIGQTFFCPRESLLVSAKFILVAILSRWYSDIIVLNKTIYWPVLKMVTRKTNGLNLSAQWWHVVSTEDNFFSSSRHNLLCFPSISETGGFVFIANFSQNRLEHWKRNTSCGIQVKLDNCFGVINIMFSTITYLLTWWPLDFLHQTILIVNLRF